MFQKAKCSKGHVAYGGAYENKDRRRVICFSDDRVLHDDHGYRKCGGVLPIRQLSGGLRRKSRRRAEAAPGCARCRRVGDARHRNQSRRSRQPRRPSLTHGWRQALCFGAKRFDFGAVSASGRERACESDPACTRNAATTSRRRRSQRYRNRWHSNKTALAAVKDARN